MNNIDSIGNFQVENVTLSNEHIGDILAEDYKIGGRNIPSGTVITEGEVKALGNRKVKIRKYKSDRKNPIICEVSKIITRISEQIEILSKIANDNIFDIDTISDNIMSYIQRMIRERRINELFVRTDILDIAKRAIILLKTESKMNHTALVSIMQEERYLFHAVESMIYSIYIAIELGITGGQVVDIAIATLLHDVGTTFFNTEKKHATDKEQLLFQSHTLIGMNLLSNNQSETTQTAIISGIHHENGQQSYGVHSNLSLFVQRKTTIPVSMQEVNNIVVIADRISTERSHLGNNCSGEFILRLALLGKSGDIDRDIVRTIFRNYMSINTTAFKEGDMVYLPSDCGIYKNNKLEGTYLLLISRVDTTRPISVRGRLFQCKEDGYGVYETYERDFSFLEDFIHYI